MPMLVSLSGLVAAVVEWAQIVRHLRTPASAQCGQTAIGGGISCAQKLSHAVLAEAIGVVAWRFLPGVCGCVPFLGWQVWWRVMSCCCCCLFPGFCGGEPHRAVGACWGGWGPHTPCARQIGPHAPQPTPPSRHGSLRCVLDRRQKIGLPSSPAAMSSSVSPPSGAGAHGIARARGEPFRQSLLAVCGGRLTP